MWLYAVIGCLMIAMGLAVHVFKMYFLISGYNTMPVEKKANVDVKSIGKVMGLVFYFDGALLILTSALLYMGLKFSPAPIFVIIAISVVFMLIFLQRYDGNLFDENHKLKKGSLKQFLMPASLSTVAVIGVLVMVVWSMQPLKVTTEDDYLKISGMYGNEYAYDKIENLQYMETIPKILLRTNGASLGSHLKGHFKLEELGSVTLFVNTDFKGYVYFEYEGKKIIFNMEETLLKPIYNTLLERIK